MSLTTWLWGTSQLDDAVDKATSELLPSGSEEIALNLEICDQIRSKSVSAKDAMRALKRRLNHKNPNVQVLALGLTDICIKNGGDHFLNEVASREFMDNLVSILKMPTLNIDVKNKILRLIQNWSIAFEGKATLSYVGQVYKNLKQEGFTFPPQDLAVANSAMVDTQTAPEWIDSDVCLRCRTPFSFTNRKHHCRNCGQVFDQQCSAKTMPLPHFGITQEVRVCDGCHSKLTKKGDKADHKGHRHSTSLHGSRHRSARELADAELQRAIQLSLEEVGATHGHSRPGYVPSQPSPSAWQTSEPPLVDRRPLPDSNAAEVEEDDPDLRAAIEASLREANAPKPSAPIAVETPRSEEAQYPYGVPGYSRSYPPTVTPTPVIPSVPKLPSYDLEPLESDTILTFSQTVEQVEAQGGRDISRYPAVNELFDKANGLRPKLALSLDDTGRREKMLSEMNDKLSQAVKLYDKLLTEQVSHPTWTRSPPLPQQSGYQPINAGYNHVHPAPNGSYGPWAPSQTQPQGHAQPVPGYQSYGETVHTPRQTHSPQVSYLHRSSTQEYPGESSYAAPLAPSAPPDVQTQWQQPQHSEPHRQTTYDPHSQSQQHVQQPYIQPLQQELAQVSVPPPTPQYNPPASQSPVPYQSAALSAVRQPPLPTPESRPPVTSPPTGPPQSSPVSLPSSSGLNRHNTTSYPSSRPQHPTNSLLVRHNTVAPPPQAQQQPSLPAFPVVPTSAPQSFSMYGSSIPQSVPQPERKEALLIDL